MLNFAVIQQAITLKSDETMIQEMATVIHVGFTFDSTWDGFKKTAVFRAGTIEVPVELIDDKCTLPSECLVTAGLMLKVMVQGQKDDEALTTPWCSTSRILYPITPKPQTDPGPIPSEEVGRLCEEFATELNAQYTEEELKSKSLYEVLGNLDNLGNTATDSEVEDVINDVWGPETGS